MLLVSVTQPVQQPLLLRPRRRAGVEVRRTPVRSQVDLIQRDESVGLVDLTISCAASSCVDNAPGWRQWMWMWTRAWAGQCVNPWLCNTRTVRG